MELQINKCEVFSYKQIFILIAVHVLSVIAAVLSNVVSNNLTSTVKIGLPLLLISYFIIMSIYLPLLFTMRLFRGERLFGQVFRKSLTILLWSFIPLSGLWVLLVIGKVLLNIPWDIFNNTFIWGKTFLIPLSLTLFYWKYTKESVSDSIIDSMLISGFMLVLSFINF